MLILTRRPGESIWIGDSVQITVLSVKGKQVRFGITALDDVRVQRQEVFERRQEEEAKELTDSSDEVR